MCECVSRGGQPLSKLKADGLSARKWTKLLMTMLHGLVDCLCRSHCMTMCLYFRFSTRAAGGGVWKESLMVFTNGGMSSGHASESSA